MSAVSVSRRADALVAVHFQAMASPCELLVATADDALAKHLGEIAAAEAWRIEKKYSRYRDDSVTSALNRSAGIPVELDEETRALLEFAAQCHRLSDGAFDITSGILRRAWRFDGSNRMPEPAQVERLLERVGFSGCSGMAMRWRCPREWSSTSAASARSTRWIAHCALLVARI